jgi:hypothetical protein
MKTKRDQQIQHMVRRVLHKLSVSTYATPELEAGKHSANVTILDQQISNYPNRIIKRASIEIDPLLH